MCKSLSSRGLTHSKGAVIISKRVEINDKDKIIFVEDCVEALQKMALYKR